MIYHNQDREEIIDVKKEGGHFDGDQFLVDNFADVVRCKDISHANLKSGILSAKMCLMQKNQLRSLFSAI